MHLEAFTTGFAAMNLFKLFTRNGGALESDVVEVFSKSPIMRGSTTSPNNWMSSKRAGPTPRSCANFTVGTDMGSKPAIVTAT